MKFEIDDKTGMILDCSYTPDYHHADSVTTARSLHLEQILQAVKKTQEKLLNKQIQEIQDSKKWVDPYETYPEKIKEFVKSLYEMGFTKETIERNQKIVEGIQYMHKHSQMLIDSYQLQISECPENGLDKDFLQQESEKYLFIRRDLEDMVLHKTGKEIKDLDNFKGIESVDMGIGVTGIKYPGLENPKEETHQQKQWHLGDMKCDNCGETRFQHGLGNTQCKKFQSKED